MRKLKFYCLALLLMSGAFLLSPFLCAPASAQAVYSPAPSIAGTPGLQVALNGRQVVGTNCVFWGDSWTQMSSAMPNTFGAGYAFNLAALSGGRIKYLYNAGIAGQTSAQILARWSTDVLAKNPSLVFLLAGINDIGNSVAFATWQANMRQMVALCKTNNIRPVVLTIPPIAQGIGAGTAAVRTAQCASWDIWLMAYCAQQGVTCIDSFAPLADPATGQFLAAYTTDGVHPNDVGMRVYAQYIWAQISASIPANTPYLSASNVDPNNLLSNGLFLNSSGGVGTSWGGYGGATVVNSIVTGDSTIAGNWQKCVMSSANGGGFYLFGDQTIAASSAWAAGDKLAFSCKVQMSGLEAGGGKLGVKIVFNGAGAGWDMAYVIGSDLPGGVIYSEQVIPAGTTSMEIQLKINGNGNASGTAQIAQATLIDLTKQSAATP